jgi:putative sugar O-methyltransferase
MRQHYFACERNVEISSVTWQRALSLRRPVYELEDLESMLVPGSKANTWIRNLCNFVDATLIDPTDPIERVLLEIGESPVGRPYQDVAIGTQRCSSLFVFNLRTAAQIIRHIESARIERPRILEIGGGYGTLMGLLRAYFGDRATFFAVDLPETLALQEWYLRTRFPEASSCYKATSASAAFEPGGLNFINAYVLSSQDVAIDVAINIDSMGEMQSQVAEGYIRFVERNVAVGGFFYFQNAHRLCEGGTADISEYPFDPQWDIVEAVLATPPEVMAWMPFFRIVLQRSAHRYDPDVRRVILRVLLNAYHTGMLARGSSQAVAVLKLMRTAGDPQTALSEAASLTSDAVLGLRNALYLPTRYFGAEFEAERLPSAHDLGGYLFSAVRALERQITGAMRCGERLADDAGIAGTLANAIRARDAATEQFLGRLPDQPLGEYWTAWVSGLLLLLGRPAEGVRLLRNVEPAAASSAWLTRYASLFDRFGYGEDVRRLDNLLRSRDDLAWFDRIKLDEIEGLQGDRAAALADIELLADGAKSYMYMTIAKTALRLNAPALAESLLEKYNAHDLSSLPPRLELAAFALSEGYRTITARVLDEARQITLDDGDPTGLRLEVGALLMRMGNPAGSKPFVAAQDSCGNDYYLLGRLGRLLHKAGAHDWAEELLDRSVALGPRTAQQLRFVGDVRFDAGLWEAAAECYGKAHEDVPHLPALAGKAAFCRLHPSVREGAIFGRASDLQMLFQTEPTFYHDIGVYYMSAWNR